MPPPSSASPNTISGSRGRVANVGSASRERVLDVTFELIITRYAFDLHAVDEERRGRAHSGGASLIERRFDVAKVRVAVEAGFKPLDIEAQLAGHLDQALAGERALVL